MSELYPYAKALIDYRVQLAIKGHTIESDGIKPRHIRAIATMAEEYMDRYGIDDHIREDARFVYHAPWVHVANDPNDPIMTEVSLVRIDDRWALERLAVVSRARRYINRGQLILTEGQNEWLLQRMRSKGQTGNPVTYLAA